MTISYIHASTLLDAIIILALLILHSKFREKGPGSTMNMSCSVQGEDEVVFFLPLPPTS